MAIQRMIMLPKKKSVPGKDLSTYTLLLYGREKIGKTSLASHFPDAVFLMFEPGGRALTVYQVEVGDWPDFKLLLKQLEDDKRFKTIVIDTIDLAYRLCLEWVSKKILAGSHPADMSYGIGWDRLKDEFQKRIAQLCKCGKGVVFLSHDTVREDEKADGTKVSTTMPSMSGVARGVIEPMIDCLGYYYYDADGKRQLCISGTREVVAGCRMKEAGFFKDVDDIFMGTTSKQAYNNFLSAMGTVKGQSKRRRK